MKTKGLALVLPLVCATGLMVGCAARPIRCRFTKLDARFKPIKPHDRWVRGINGCLMEIQVLAEQHAPQTVGVQVHGSAKQREELYKQVKQRQNPPVEPGTRISFMASGSL